MINIATIPKDRLTCNYEINIVIDKVTHCWVNDTVYIRIFEHSWPGRALIFDERENPSIKVSSKYDGAIEHLPASWIFA